MVATEKKIEREACVSQAVCLTGNGDEIFIGMLFSTRSDTSRARSEHYLPLPHNMGEDKQAKDEEKTDRDCETQRHDE